MITAFLYIGLNRRLAEPIRINTPREYIRISLEHPLQEDERDQVVAQTTSFTVIGDGNIRFATDDGSTSNFTHYVQRSNKEPHIIFRLWRKWNEELYDYLLDGLGDFPYRRFAASMRNVEDVGFREPDENVNLKKLRRKLRSKKKMKKLLLQYYRA